jgi:hypothetical protein
MTMQTIATPDGRLDAPIARLAACPGPRVRSFAQYATIVGAAILVALLAAWVVAATLALGADGHPGVGPDRPPPPMLLRDESWPTPFAADAVGKENLR